MKTNNKGVSLIIAIFVLMLLAVLGWTLAVMQSADFEGNLRNLDSERALGLAEAGVHYALQQLAMSSGWRTGNGDTDCNDSGDWVTHTLSSGTYSFCCRAPLASETGSSIIESRGYVPSAANYRAMRQLKLNVTLGTFEDVLQTRNLFDWTAMHAGSKINGGIRSLYYEADGDGNYNEAGTDYANGSTPLPEDGGVDHRKIAADPYAIIDMSYFEAEAGARTWACPRTAKITNITTVDGGTRTQLDLDSSIFSGPYDQWDDQALRNITLGSWQAGNWLEINDVSDGNTVKLEGVVNWGIGQRVTVVPKISSVATDIANRTYTIQLTCSLAWSEDEAVRDFTRGTWNYSDWGVIRTISTGAASTTLTVRVDDSVDLNNALNRWAVNDWIGEVRRYRDNVTTANPGGVWYIESDVLFDLRDRQSWEPGSINGDITLRRTSFVAEGDVWIRGPNKIQFTERPFEYPNLASKNGNIISPDLPSGGNEGQKRKKRDFNDVVFTENGDLYFNYLDAKAAYGYNVTFDGQVIINYDKDIVRLTGFSWSLPDIEWQEN